MGSSQGPDAPPGGGSERQRRVGWVLTGLGFFVIVLAVLRVANAGYGDRPKLRFSERRSYDMVKRDVHRAFPGALAQALGGFGLILLGARVRRRP